MTKRDYVFASESVSEGHPDKVCDRISDAVVDTFLAADPQSRCGVETLATTNRVVIAGGSPTTANSRPPGFNCLSHESGRIGVEPVGISAINPRVIAIASRMPAAPPANDNSRLSINSRW